jgi:hypothetical protein
MPTTDREIQGDLRRYPLPRLFFFLAKKEFLGLFELEKPEGIVYFRGGSPVYTTLASEEDLLGRVLLERGLITEECYNLSLQELALRGGLHGQILLRMRAIDEEGLSAGLLIQLRRKLIRLFKLEEGPFRLQPCDHDRGSRAEEKRVRADPLWVIHQGVRSHFTPERMQPELEKLKGRTVALKAGAEGLLERFGFSADERTFLGKLQGASLPFEEAIGTSCLEPLVCQMILYALWVTEVVQLLSPTGAVTGRDDTPPVASRPAVEPPPSTATEAPRPAVLIPPPPSAVLIPPPPSETPTPPSSSVAVAPPSTPEPVVPPPRRKAISDGLRAVTLSGARYVTPSRSTASVVPPAPGGGNGPATGPSTRGPTGMRRGPTTPDSIRAVTLTGNRVTVPTEPSQPAVAVVPPAVVTSPTSPTLPSEKAVPGKGRSTQSVDTPTQHAALVHKMHEGLGDKSHYEILEVPRNATTDKIRDAYFKAAKIYHPDRCSALGLKDLSALASEIFRRISEANSTLSDVEKRREYDRVLAGGEPQKKDVSEATEAEFAFQKGMVYFRKKDFAEALENFRMASRLNPKEGEHIAWAAWTLFSDPRQNRERLLPILRGQLQEAISLSPKNAACWYFLGEVFLALGEERKAVNAFNRTLEFQPGQVDAERHLRLIHMRQGKRKEEKGILGRLMTREKKTDEEKKR